MQTIINDTRNDAPTPRLEITTPAVHNPGVTVELEAGGVSGGRKENTMSWSHSHDNTFRFVCREMTVTTSATCVYNNVKF